METNKVFLAMTLALALLFLQSCKKAEGGAIKKSTVLAEVGDKKITYGEVEEFAQKQVSLISLQGQVPDENMMKELRKKALDHLVNMEIVQQELKKKGVTITDEDINQAYQEEIQRMGGEEQMNRLLAARGATAEDLKEIIKQRLPIFKLQDIVTADVPPATEDEARAYYDKNQQMFNAPERVHAYHILIKVSDNPSDEEWAQAKKKAEEIAAKARQKGADFEALAKQFSEDPGSAPNGGDLGYFRKGQMVPEFEGAAFSLPIGKVSAPVKTKFGYHIIKVTDKKKSGIIPYEEISGKIIQKLTDDRKREKWNTYFQELQAKVKYPNPLPEPEVPASPHGPGGMPPHPVGGPPSHQGVQPPP